MGSSVTYLSNINSSLTRVQIKAFNHVRFHGHMWKLLISWVILPTHTEIHWCLAQALNAMVTRLSEMVDRINRERDDHQSWEGQVCFAGKYWQALSVSLPTIVHIIYIPVSIQCVYYSYVSVCVCVCDSYTNQHGSSITLMRNQAATNEVRVSHSEQTYLRAPDRTKKKFRLSTREMFSFELFNGVEKEAHNFLRAKGNGRFE